MKRYIFGTTFLMALVVMAVLVGACGSSSPSQGLPTAPPTWTPAEQTIKATPTETVEAKLTPTPAPTKKATATPLPTATYTPEPTPTKTYAERDIPRIDGKELVPLLVHINHNEKIDHHLAEIENILYDGKLDHEEMERFNESISLRYEITDELQNKGCHFDYNNPVQGTSTMVCDESNIYFFMFGLPELYNTGFHPDGNKEITYDFLQAVGDILVLK